VEAECLIPPRALLDEIHKIESEGGRTRTVRWEDRTLDIDIIFFGDKIIAERGLAIPHPDYANRSFVLEPIKEIAPDFVCPVTRKRMSDL
jgi:2-amino-4-hydroxy-6-hydroxymethyldihydropteridine diphosphokinase